MASTPESKVKARVVMQLRKVGAFYFFPQAGGFGKSGIPDIIACYRGVFIGIECKAGANKPTKLQEQKLEQISNAGGMTMVINEANIETVGKRLTDIADAITFIPTAKERKQL